MSDMVILYFAGNIVIIKYFSEKIFVKYLTYLKLCTFKTVLVFLKSLKKALRKTKECKKWHGKLERWNTKDLKEFLLVVVHY